MTEVIRAAAELQSFCETQGWKYCFIGGLALQRGGEPRETVDVDLTLLTGFGDEERFVKILLGTFESRIENAAEFALTRRVLLLREPRTGSMSKASSFGRPDGSIGSTLAIKSDLWLSSKALQRY